MPQDIKYYQEFGGEKIVFEKEETAEIKKLGDKGDACSQVDDVFLRLSIPLFSGFFVS